MPSKKTQGLCELAITRLRGSQNKINFSPETLVNPISLILFHNLCTAPSKA